MSILVWIYVVITYSKIQKIQRVRKFCQNVEVVLALFADGIQKYAAILLLRAIYEEFVKSPLGPSVTQWEILQFLIWIFQNGEKKKKRKCEYSSWEATLCREVFNEEHPYSK